MKLSGVTRQPVKDEEGMSVALFRNKRRDKELYSDQVNE